MTKASTAQQAMSHRDLRDRLMDLKDKVIDAYMAVRTGDLAVAKAKAADVQYDAGVVVAMIEEQQTAAEQLAEDLAR